MGDYLLSLLEHLDSRPQALARGECKGVWLCARRVDVEPEQLGGERLRPAQVGRGSWRDGEELPERCRDEQLRGEALELRWWWW